MKRLTIFTTVFFITTMLGATAQAQHQDGGGRGMMDGGTMSAMHQQMMQNPLHRQCMAAFMLPALADTLALSDQQRSRLKQHKSELMRQGRKAKEARKAHKKQLMSIFEDEGQPGPDEVREHLMVVAELQTDRKVARYETAQAMQQVLTDAQRQTLKGLMMRQMMKNMPMMDMMQMMQMMQAMHGGGMMQRGGMPMMMMQHMQQMRQGGMHAGEQQEREAHHDQ